MVQSKSEWNDNDVLVLINIKYLSIIFWGETYFHFKYLISNYMVIWSA